MCFWCFSDQFGEMEGWGRGIPDIYELCKEAGMPEPEFDFVARRGDEVIYVQVTLQVSGDETYERELTSSTSNATRPSERKRSRRSLLSQFGNLKLIKDNYPKYVVTLDPNVGLIHDSGIVACTAREFLLKSEE